MPHPSFTDEQIATMAAEYMEGISLPQLGKKYGKAPATIRAALIGRVTFRRRGEPPVRRPDAPLGICTLTADQVNKAMYMYVEEKKSLAAVASQLGTHAPAVRRALIARGVVMRQVHMGGVRRHTDAILIANCAIQEGDLVRGPCEVCGVSGFTPQGRPAVIGHHDDYNLPLVVRWLCPLHHRQWHQNNQAYMVGEGPNGDLGAQTLGEYLALYDLEGATPQQVAEAVTQSGEEI